MIDDTQTGVLAYTGNELINDAKNDDPSAYRGGRPAPGVLVKFSGDFYVLDPSVPGGKRRYERVFAALGTDESGGCGGAIGARAVLPGKDGDEHTVPLFDIDTRQALFHVPIVALAGVHSTPRPWPWEHSDPTHGIPAGDFARVLEVYGFASDEEQPYRDGRMTWEQVIARQDARDDFAHFPKADPPVPPFGPSPDDWLSPASQAKRAQEIERIRHELAPLELDEDRVRAYMEGRNRKLHEVHDDELTRSGLSVDPCGGAHRVPL